MSSSSEQIDDQQHKTQRMMKKFMNNKVKGLKEKMSELIASSNCQKMKSSWSSEYSKKLEVVHDALRKFQGKNKIEKKKNAEETDQKYDETTTRVSSSMKEEKEELSPYSMLIERLNELDEKLEKTMKIVRVIETVLERSELVRKCGATVKDEEEQMSHSDETDDDDDESESGYCTPDPNLD